MPTITIQPDQITGFDSYVDIANPTTNYGNDTNIKVGWTPPYPSSSVMGLLKFDLTPVQGYLITSAILSLYCHGITGTNYATALYRITSTWDKAVVTWNTQPSFDSGVRWDLQTPILNNWLNLDGTFGTNLKDLIQAWIDGTYPNYGFLLRTEAISNTVLFYSSDYLGASIPSPNLRPKLTLTYVIPPSGNAGGSSVLGTFTQAVPSDQVLMKMGW